MFLRSEMGVGRVKTRRRGRLADVSRSRRSICRNGRVAALLDGFAPQPAALPVQMEEFDRQTPAAVG